MKRLFTTLSLVFSMLLSVSLLAQPMSSGTITASGISSVSVTADTVRYDLNLMNQSYVSLSTYQVMGNAINDAILTLRTGDGSQVIATADNNAGLQAIISDVVLAAGTYQVIMIDKVGGGMMNRNFAFQTIVTDAVNFRANIPANDTICRAFNLPLDSVYTMQSNQFTTQQRIQGENNLSGALSGKWTETSIANSLWYKFTGTSNDIHSLKFTSLTNNVMGNATQIAIYEGTCDDFTNLILVKAAELNTSGTDSVLAFCIQPGVQYYVLVDGEGLSYSTFNFQLNTFELPEFSLLLSAGDTSTRVAGGGPVGFACPADTITYDLIAQLVNAEDSSSISSIYADYVNDLKFTITGDADSAMGVDAFTFQDLRAGTYTVTVTDVCGSTKMADFTFIDTIPDPVNIILSDLTDADCITNGTGSVSVQVEGGIQFNVGPLYNPYFLFNSTPEHTFPADSNFAEATPGTPNFMALPSGTYRLYYEDACGVYDSVQFNINPSDYNLITLDSLAGQNPFCVGNTDGSLEIEAIGGQNAGLNYTWYRTMIGDTAGLFNMANIVMGEDKALIDTIGQGLYGVIVSDLCADSMNVNRDTLLLTLTDPTFDSLMVSLDTVAPSTYNSADGSASIVKMGGSELDSVIWSFNGQRINRFDNDLEIDTLSQGYYVAEYKDFCLDTTVVFQFNLFAPLSNDDICDAIRINVGDSIDRFSNVGASIQSGEESISIPVDPMNGWSAENEIQSSVWFSFIAPASGSVNVEVKTMGFPFLNTNFDPQVAIFGGDCNNIGGLQLLSANDNNAASVGNDNNSLQRVNCLTPGQEYFILVDGSEGLGQEGIFTIDLTHNAVQEVVLVSTLATIDCNNPTATLTVNQPMGGIAPIVTVFDGDTLVFSSGQSTVTGITEGTYQLIAYDRCGIADEKTIEVEGFENRPFAIDFDITEATCPMGMNASVDFTFGGGASINNYFIEVRKGMTVVQARVSTDSTFTVNGLNAGEYSATLEDNCGNEREFAFIIDEPVITPLVSSTTIEQPACNGGTGDVSIDVSGGSGIFFYNLSMDRNNLDVPANMTQDTANIMLNDLAIGTYYLFVREFCVGNAFGNDTAFIDTIEIVSPMLDPLSIDVITVSPTVAGASDGSFIFTIEGGLEPYFARVFTFTNNVKGDTLDFDENNVVSGIPAGTYRIEYTDSCTAGVLARTVIVLDPPVNNAPCESTLLTLGTTRTGNNQAASLTAVDADVTAPDLNASCFVQGTWCADGITAPMWYTFVVPASGNVVVELSSSDFDPQAAVYSTTDCTNGSSFTLVGASDDQSPTNDDARILLNCQTPGDTLYVLVDPNEVPVPNRRGSFAITVSDNPSVTLKVFDIVTNASTNLSSNGAIDLDIIGGSAPYTIIWSDDEDAPEDRSNLSPGIYTVTVFDDCGVSVTREIEVGFNERSNDRACNAVALALNSTVDVSTVGAGTNPGEPSPSTNGTCTNADVLSWCDNDGINNTVWYTFKAPQNGMVNLSTCGDDNSVFDTQLAVYTATDCQDFTTFNLIAANDDRDDCDFGGSQLMLSNLSPCATYYVQVDSKGPQGVAQLSITAETALSAGEDNAATVCVYDNTFDLSTLLSGANMGGTFVDSTNMGALTGSIVDLDALNLEDGETLVYYYVIGEMCNGMFNIADAARFVLTADNCVGIDENSTVESLNVYPNPSKTEIFVSQAKGSNILVLSSDGKVVISKRASEKETRLDISTLAPGIYTISSGEEQVRLIKQ